MTDALSRNPSHHLRRRRAAAPRSPPALGHSQLRVRAVRDRECRVIVCRARLRSTGRLRGDGAESQGPYRELIVGTYTRVTWDGQSVLVALGYADATDSEYLQTYVSPSLSRGPLTLSGTIEWYAPIERSGTRQLDVNPISLVVRVNQSCGLGALYTLGLARGDAPPQRGGPMLGLTAP